jgi:hypothetical protein
MTRRAKRSPGRGKPERLPTVEELLGHLVAVRGTEDAGIVIEMLGFLLDSGTWKDADRLIRHAQALSDAGAIDEDERYFLISLAIDGTLPSRAALSPAFVEVERRMAEYEKAHGYAEDDLALLEDQSPEYREMTDGWAREADLECARWMRELGEPLVARWLEHDRDELEERHYMGFASFVPFPDDELDDDALDEDDDEGELPRTP